MAKNNKKQKRETYIDKLKFKESFKNSFIGKYLSNIRIAVILLITIVLAGINSYVNLPKTLSPEVDLPAFYVTTILPGGSPDDIERMITKPIEKEIKKIEGIDEYNSISQENVSVVSIQFSTGVDSSKARSDVQAALDSVKNTLPEDSMNPELNQVDFENVPVWVFGLAKKENTNDIASLMKMANQMKDSLEDIDSVSRVEINGLDQREIQIVIKPEFVKENNVNIFSLSNKIQESLAAYPAGKVVNSGSDFSVSIDRDIDSISDIRNMDINFEDVDYKLFDIADISEKSEIDQAHSFIASKDFGQKQIVVFYAFKTSDGQIEDTYELVKEKVEEKLKPYRDGFEVFSISNYSDEINDQINDLMDNFVQTLVLVFISMFLLYGIRQSMIASVSIPLSILIIVASMQVFGFSVNFISIYSLLIALGLFTDNAVVIIEGFTSIYKSGKFNAFQSAIMTFRDYALELLVINLLTCWSFLPLLAMPGIMGEFIRPLPILVSVAMMASVLVAVTMTLPSMMILSDLKIAKRVKVLGIIISIAVALGSFAYLASLTNLSLAVFILLVFLAFSIFYLRKSLKAKVKDKVKSSKRATWLYKFSRRSMNKGLISLESLTEKYHELITRLINNKKRRVQVLIMVLIVTVFSFSLPILGFVKGEFFPKTEGETIYIELELPDGTKKAETTRQAEIILNQLKDKEYAAFVTAEVQAKYSGGFNITQAKGNNVLFSMFLEDGKDRELDFFEIEKELRSEFGNYEKGKINIIAEGDGGPPSGADIDISIAGDDLDELKSIADEISSYLETQEGVNNIERNMNDGMSKLVFQADKEKLKFYGISQSQIGFQLRNMLSGFTSDEMNIDNRDYDIVIRLSDDLVNVDELSSLVIGANGKGYIPIGELGEFHMKANPTVINRKDGKRTITVTASVMKGYNSVVLNSELAKYVENDMQLPDGYSWKIGGSNEMNDEANASIVQGMGISIILIMVTLVLQLKSFRKAMIVIVAIPIAMSGVFVGFALLGINLSMPAMMGLLSLFGIVIANSLMIVDKIDKNLEIGFSFNEAITEAASSRIEPILLTSSAQIVGLIPTTLADPVWRGFGGSIIFGLGYSAMLMLFFIPVVYYYLMKWK